VRAKDSVHVALGLARGRRRRRHQSTQHSPPNLPPKNTSPQNSIRDLNDEINKLIREKGHWERRIVELGGPDYAKAAPKVTADDGDDAAAAAAATTAGGGGAGGYRYFGAAKQLPGVKEMFEKPAPRAASRRTRAQLAKNLTPDYFGFRDEDDGALLRLERAAERGTYSEARMREWEAACGGGGGAGEEGGQAKRGRRDEEQAAAGRRGGAAGAATGAGDDGFAAFVPLPDRAAIESLVVAKKKRDLLARYASEASLQQQAEAAALANPSAAKPPPR
jgi:pre-mRNA-splicing factor ISY1